MDGLPARVLSVFDALAWRIFTKSTPTIKKVEQPYILRGEQDRTYGAAGSLLGISGRTVGAMVRAGRMEPGAKEGTVTASSLRVMLEWFDHLGRTYPDGTQIAGLLASLKAEKCKLGLSLHEGITATQTTSKGIRTGYGPTIAGALADLAGAQVRTVEVANG